MKKNKIQFLLPFVIFVFISYGSLSQVSTKNNTSQKTVLNKSENFFEIKDNFNNYWDSKNVENGYYFENGIKKKAYGWKQFKRWEWYWATRVNPTTGKFPNKSASDFYINQKNTSGNRNATGNWTSMGPTSSSGGYSGIGRLNCVIFRAGDNSTIYTGSPSGGLWKTTDGGSNWNVLTDNNGVLGVSDAVVIAGATTSTDIIYIATGDRDGGSMWSLGGGQWHDNNSIGVLKSTDGGATWLTTGLAFTASQKRTINRLLLDPIDNSIVYAASSDGLYKTINSGTTWNNINGTQFIDIKFKPGESQTVYGSTRDGKIYLSTNAGSTWSKVSDNNAAGARRVDLAVSANEPSWVYAVEVNSTGGLFGIYKSTDSGATFSLAFNSSNILEGNCAPIGSSGQGSYDLAIAADPNNANVLFVGGVNTWKSTDGGSNWSISNMWSGTCGGAAINVHADKHFLAYQNGTSTLFECNDGGLYKTTDAGSTWSHIGNGLVISQLYRIGVAQTNSGYVVAGLQDNGTKAKVSGIWNDVIGGDGMDCMIDYTNEDIQYGEAQNGGLKRTTNHWGSYTDITTGLSGSPYWVMPIAIDPNVNTTIYTGTQDVFKSIDQGTNWTKISNWGGSTLKELAIAPSNSNYIYTTTQSILYRTTDGGTNWSNITGTLPTGTSSITYIAIKDDDPNTVWVSMGQYNSDGVYQTTDGGTTWSDISTGLPAIPVMCIVQNTQNTAQTELYCGTDIGIYVKIDGGSWALFSDGLPNVVVNELKIYYDSGTPSLSKIRAGTSGRGMWESELYSPPNTAPVTDFSADITNPGVNQTVSFSDLSTNVPTSWLWSFTPSTVNFVGGTSATSQNPQVEFTVIGDYAVQLTATNAFGSDIKSKTNYITASALQSYCTASGSGDAYISGVQIGLINNQGTTASDYINYTALSTNLTVNQTYNIIITSRIEGYSIGYYYSNSDIGIWIDWNQDGDFIDAEENVSCNVGATTYLQTFAILVPDNPLIGSTTMRIRHKLSDTDCGFPCGTTSYGEVEDYKINVLPGTNNWLGITYDWNDASNWSDGNVPNSSYEVIIPSGVTSPIIPSGTNAKCYSITLQNDAEITINGNLEVEK